jgi:peptide chain release factor subunit 1
MTDMTWSLVRELAEFRSREPGALSLYVRLDPSESPTPQALSTRFNSLLTQVEKTYLANGDETHRRKSIRDGLQRIRDWADTEFDRDGARGVAVFVSADDDYWRVVHVPDPVEDHVGVDRQFSVAPLVRVVHDDDVFVAQMDRERGAVFQLVDGRLDEIVDESDEVPGQHDQGGWSQARYQRHIEKLVKEHLKAVGGELDGELRRSGAPQLVIVAPEEIRTEIESHLSPETKDAIVGWARAEPHSTPAELLTVVQPILAEAREARERDALARWQELLARDGRASAGWGDTLEAASDARVELLLASPAAAATGYRCPECLRATAEPGTCPLDGTPLEEHDALDLAVHQTLVHGGRVLTLDASRDGLESIGALLRF